MSTTTTTLRSPRSSRIPSPSSSSSPPAHSPRRPSISNTMHWLSRTASPNTAAPYSPSKPHRVSEPKRVRTIDIINPPARNGTLGAGATVVRTPDEALRETGVRLSPEMFEREALSSSSLSHRLSSEQGDTLKPKKRSSTIYSQDSSTPTLAEPESQTLPLSPPTSPPLPPLPLADAEEEAAISEPESPTSNSKPPPRPSRAPPSPPSRRSSLKSRTIVSTVEDAPSVPPLPPHVVASTQPPPFHALLISEPSLMITDPCKIMVTLETCTATHRTTLATIQSRPSHLSNYLSSLLFSQPADTRSIASVYSNETDDLAIYTRHLTSQGLVPHSGSINLFLDRPSSPYSHILAYLRTPVIEGQPEILPRSLQVHSPLNPQDRLESLIEVREEAAFLNLEGLHRLCTDEIRHRYGPRFHTRGNSVNGGASIHSLRASVYSLHTLLERVETDLGHTSGVVNNSSLEGYQTQAANPTMPSSPSKKSPGSLQQQQSTQDSTSASRSRSRSPPTPQSWEGPTVERRSQSQQSMTRHSSQPLKSAPAGWI